MDRHCYLIWYLKLRWKVKFSESQTDTPQQSYGELWNKLEELLPSDIIFLNIGDIVPADATILEFDSFQVNESVLTGESFPIEKKVEDQIYAGSVITAGLAYAKVDFTWLNTKFGKIAKTIAKKQSKNSFEQGIDKFGNLIIKVAFLIVVSVILIILSKGFITGRQFDLAYFDTLLLYYTYNSLLPGSLVLI